MGDVLFGSIAMRIEERYCCIYLGNGCVLMILSLTLLKKWLKTGNPNHTVYTSAKHFYRPPAAYTSRPGPPSSQQSVLPIFHKPHSPTAHNAQSPPPPPHHPLPTPLHHHHSPPHVHNHAHLPSRSTHPHISHQ